METFIWAMLIINAPKYDINPYLAAAVVKTESNFNSKAVGSLGELGLFQIRPEYSKYSRRQLLDPYINIIAGLEMLERVKRKCKHTIDKTFLTCYNAGITGGSKLKYPKRFPYYNKVYSRYYAYNMGM